MNSSIHTTIGRTGLALIAAVMTAVFAGSALAGRDRPAASFYTPAQLEAISQSWAARGGVFDRPAASFYTPQQIQAISQSWAARARHEAATSQTTLRTGSGLDWGDFGIGAGAMLGLVLLLGGLAAGAHYGRRSGVDTRTAS